MDLWHMIMDPWHMIMDPWHMIMDLWHIIMDLWHMMTWSWIHDTWLWIHDTWSWIHDTWPQIHDLSWILVIVCKSVTGLTVLLGVTVDGPWRHPVARTRVRQHLHAIVGVLEQTRQHYRHRGRLARVHPHVQHWNQQRDVTTCTAYTFLQSSVMTYCLKRAC